MRHIDDSEIYQYVSGGLPEAKAQQIRRHMAECEACRSRYQDAVALWDTLGFWQVDSSGHQIADRIEALAAKTESNQRKSRTGTIPFIRTLGVMFRVAAVIIIAIVGGHLLGRYSLPRSKPVTSVAQDKPKYVAALGFEWSSELTWTVLEEETVSTETN
jgi:anti-sigma factor RsiW